MQKKNILSKDQYDTFDKLEQKMNDNIAKINKLCGSISDTAEITKIIDEVYKIEQPNQTEKNNKEIDVQELMPQSIDNVYENIVNSFEKKIKEQNSLIEQIQKTINQDDSEHETAPKQKSDMSKELDKYLNF